MTITHPFHPLLGQRFKFLKLRNYQGTPLISLKTVEGAPFCVPADWTDRSDYHINQEAGISPTILSALRLIELADYVDSITIEQ